MTEQTGGLNMEYLNFGGVEITPENKENFGYLLDEFEKDILTRRYGKMSDVHMVIFQSSWHDEFHAVFDLMIKNNPDNLIKRHLIEKEKVIAEFEVELDKLIQGREFGKPETAAFVGNVELSLIRRKYNIQAEKSVDLALIREWSTKYSRTLERNFSGLLTSSDPHLDMTEPRLYSGLLDSFETFLYQGEKTEGQKPVHMATKSNQTDHSEDSDKYAHAA